MAVEIFTKSQFECALPKDRETGELLWKALGTDKGEYVYEVETRNPLVKIRVRSSVHMGGVSAESGEDSIRAWLTDESGNTLAAKIQRWVTRVTGWQKRLLDLLRKMDALAEMIGPCPKCKKTLSLVRIKKEGPNKGKLALTCQAKVNGEFANHMFQILEDQE